MTKKIEKKPAATLLEDMELAISYLRDKIKAGTAKAADTEVFRKLVVSKADALLRTRQADEVKKREPWSAKLRLVANDGAE